MMLTYVYICWLFEQLSQKTPRWVEQPTSTSGAAPGSVAALHWPVAYGGVQLLHCPLHWTFHAVWGFSVSWFLYLGLSCLYLPLALAFYPCWFPCNNFAAFVSVQRALKGLCVGSRALSLSLSLWGLHVSICKSAAQPASRRRYKGLRNLS